MNNRGAVRSAPQTPSLGDRERLEVNAMTHSLGMLLINLEKRYISLHTVEKIYGNRTVSNLVS